MISSYPVGSLPLCGLPFEPCGDAVPISPYEVRQSTDGSTISVVSRAAVQAASIEAPAIGSGASIAAAFVQPPASMPLTIGASYPVTCRVQPASGGALTLAGTVEEAFSAPEVEDVQSDAAFLTAGSYSLLGGLPAGFTFTRASGRTYIDSTGVLQTAGNDVAPEDYDPITLFPLGIPLEPSSTNQIRNPRAEGATAGPIGGGGQMPINWGDYATNGLTCSVQGFGYDHGIPCVDLRWSGTASSDTATATVFPETATQIVAAAGQIWTASAFVRLIAGAVPANYTMNIIEYTASGVFVAGSGINISAMLGTTSLIANRLTCTRTLTGGTTARISITITGSATVGTAIDFTVRIGLPQLEQQPWASSPIMPPAGSPAASTRASDNLTLALPYAGFPGATGWTAALEFVPLALPGSNTVPLALCATTGFADTTYVQALSSGFVDVVKRISPTFVSSSLAGPLTSGGAAKVVIAQDTVDARLAINGAAVVVGALAGYPPMTALAVGRLADSSSASIPMHARRLRLWAGKLTDATLQAITT